MDEAAHAGLERSQGRKGARKAPRFGFRAVSILLAEYSEDQWDLGCLPPEREAGPSRRLLPHADPLLSLSSPSHERLRRFPLILRDDWRRIRGHPQVISAGLHLDSFAIYAAIFSGTRQVILRDPMKLHHVDHPRKEPAPSQDIMDCLKMMRFVKRPIILNDEGFGDDLA